MADAPRAGWRDLGVVGCMGCFALAAQTLLFRAFLTAFEGNELGIACFFSSWLLWVAVGAVVGRIARWAMRGLGARFEFLPLLYIPAYLLQWWLIGHARELAGVRPYELFPLLTLLPVTFLANAPVSFCTGLLFTLACRWWRARGGLPVATVYVWESAGSVLGGLAVTLLLAQGTAEETVFLCAALLPAAMTAVYRFHRRWTVAAVLPVLAVAAALGLGAAGRWERRNDMNAWRRVMSTQAWLGRFTTPEARYLYGEYGDQFNVVAWESVADTIPATEAASKVVAIHLAQRPEARRFLVIGRGGFSVCRRLLALPQAETITWFDPDPAYPAPLLSRLPERFLAGVDRLDIPADDIRHWLKQARPPYDAVILSGPDVTTLALNRYFTREFFELVKARLSKRSVIGVRVSAGENVMSEDRVNTGASVFATLRSVFPHLVIAPGDDTWLLASEQPGLSEAPAALRDRFAAVPGAAELYPPDGLMALYLPPRIEYVTQAFEGAIRNAPEGLLLNTDRSPRALLHSLLFAAREAGGSVSLGRAIRTLALHGLLILPAGLLLFPLLRTIFLLRSRDTRRPAEGVPVFDSYALVFTTGAAGMGGSLVLMYLYQSAFGSIFLHVGLISALFVLGLAIGGAAATRLLADGEERSSGLLCLVILAHALLLGGLVLALKAGSLPRLGFAAAFAVSGILSGVYVPLAACRLHAGRVPHATAGAWIEALDHLGGAAGGLVTGLILLPVFGASYGLLILALLLLANAAGLWRPVRRTGGVPDRSRERERAVGYVLLGLAVFAMAAGLLLRRGSAEDVRQSFLAFARSAAGKREPQNRQQVLGGGTVLDYVHVAGASPDVTDAAERYIFQTDALCPDRLGYGGPIALGVAVDADGTLRDVRVLRSNETPSYLEFLGPWMQRLRDRNLFAPDPLKDVDAVTGATLTSSAVLRILRKAGPAFAGAVLGMPVGPGAKTDPLPTRRWELLWLALAAAAALALRARPSRRLRRGFLVLVVLVAGVALNLQYSLDHVFSLIALRFPPPGESPAFLLVVGIPLLVVLVGNVYCGYLCPFGALQELAGECRPAFVRTDPDKTAWARGRFVKYLLLAFMTLLFAGTLDSALASSDPLVTVFARERGRLVLCLGVLLTGLAVVYPRFWCRTLCPAGAFLSLLNGLRLPGRWAPAVVPAACVYGVGERQDLDCLCCDRCRQPGRHERRALARPANWVAARSVTLPLLAAAGILAFTLAVRTLATWRHGITGTSVQGPGAAMGWGARPANMELLRSRIDQGRLSDEEARFYRRAAGESPRP